MVDDITGEIDTGPEIFSRHYIGSAERKYDSDLDRVHSPSGRGILPGACADRNEREQKVQQVQGGLSFHYLLSPVKQLNVSSSLVNSLESKYEDGTLRFVVFDVDIAAVALHGFIDDVQSKT